MIFTLKYKPHGLMIAAKVTKNFWVLLLPALRAVIFYGMRIDTAAIVYALDLIPALLLLCYSVLRWAACEIVLDGDALSVASGIFVKRHTKVYLSSEVFVRTEGGLVLRLLGCVRLTVGNSSRPVIRELYITKDLARCITESLPHNSDIAFEISPPSGSAVSYALKNLSWLLAAAFAAGFYYGADTVSAAAFILPLIFLRRVVYDMSEYRYCKAVISGNKIRVAYKSEDKLVAAGLCKEICGAVEVIQNPFQKRKGRANMRLYAYKAGKKEKIRLRHCDYAECRVFCENIL